MNETAGGQFTPRAQQVISLAQKEADRLQHKNVGPEHLLLGIVKLGQGVANNTLAKIGFDLEWLRLFIDQKYGGRVLARDANDSPECTPRAKKVLALARDESKHLGHTYVGTEHILLAILKEGDSMACTALREFDPNLQLEQVRDEVLKELDPNYLGSSTIKVKEIMDGSIELATKGVTAVPKFSELHSVEITIVDKKIQISPQFAAILLALSGSKQVIEPRMFTNLAKDFEIATPASKSPKT